MLKKILNFIVFSTLVISTISCSSQKKAGDDEQLVKKKRREVNMDKRTEAASGKLFGNLGQGNKSTTYEFATSNILWRASLESLDFIPLNTIDYSGGLIVSDWYSTDYSGESIKITVRFLSNELKASSIDVKTFKKNCKNEKCKTLAMNNGFNNKIKENIIAKARDLKIKEETTKK
jgi:hypothetical protein